MISILERIVSTKAEEVEASRALVPRREIERLAARAPAPRPFRRALAGGRVGLVAEIKRASPSKGDLAPNLDVVATARLYAENGAACCSVLTDVHFKGSLDDLRRVRAVTQIPLLRKDFIIDEYQVYESRAAGADAVLLIVGALSGGEAVGDGYVAAGAVGALIEVVKGVGMSAIVEVHDAVEVDVALAAGATLIGINNRDLRTFAVDRATTARLRRLIPPGIPVVSESGIICAEHVREVADYGAQAVLVGEALVTSVDVAAKVRELAGVSR